MARIDTFLELAVNQGGSDLHLMSGQSPRIRIHGQLHRVRFRELSVDDMERMLGEIMDDVLAERLRTELALDMAYEVETLGRFRVNVYHHAHGLAATFRSIPSKIATAQDLALPGVLTELISQPRGLTLVTGPTGSGKSTTLAALIDHINATRKNHIITIEDPIEFVHEYKQCIVTQRQIGIHSPNFAEALRNALREDPDVILVGEMRDLETIGLALTAAETGVQVFGTLHTNGAVRTVDRIINVFPSGRQEQIRTMLSESLRMVVSQQLARTTDGDGRLAVCEILVNTQGVEAMIRSGKTHQLAQAIQTGAKEGMQGLDAQLKRLAQERKIAGEEAYRLAVDKAAFEHLNSRVDVVKS